MIYIHCTKVSICFSQSSHFIFISLREAQLLQTQQTATSERLYCTPSIHPTRLSWISVENRIIFIKRCILCSHSGSPTAPVKSVIFYWSHKSFNTLFFWDFPFPKICSGVCPAQPHCWKAPNCLLSLTHGPLRLPLHPPLRVRSIHL